MFGRLDLAFRTIWTRLAPNTDADWDDQFAALMHTPLGEKMGIAVASLVFTLAPEEAESRLNSLGGDLRESLAA